MTQYAECRRHGRTIPVSDDGRFVGLCGYCEAEADDEVSRPKVLTCLPRVTEEDAAITHDLGHVAFMAWLGEVRDAREIAVMVRSTAERTYLSPSSRVKRHMIAQGTWEIDGEQNPF